MKSTHVMRRLYAVIAVVASLLWTTGGLAQNAPVAQSASLLRAAPESEGVSCAGIAAFLDALKQTDHEFHSMMLLRHGRVVAEGWWDPYAPELTHTMYSTSKSFSATAIGIAVGENRLRVDDKVISFFPDLVPNPVPPHLAALTVKHLLTMTVGHDPDPSRVIPGGSEDWVKAFLETPIVKEPGSTFLYNSMGSYMLSAVVTKVTGEKVIDYLQPRLFEPLGISGVDWETDPRGINTGGWGLRLHTADMAKFGQLFLQDGVWNGRRLLPEGWVAEASAFHIQQEPGRPAAERAKSDWLQGYGYQMWRCRHDAYRADGAFGQYIVIMPDQDAVLAITSQTSNMQGILDLVWEHLLPAMKDSALPADPAGVAALHSRLDDLALPVPVGSPYVERERQLSEKTFTLEANERNIKGIGFAFAKGECNVSLEDDRGTYAIPLKAGGWAISDTDRRGPYLVSRAKNNLAGLPPFKLAGAYRWLDDGALELTLRYIESPHTEKLECRFTDDRIDIDVSTGVTPAMKISGEVQK